jgi:hypothetical protein
MAQRAGANLDAGQSAAIRVALQSAVDFPECLQLLDGEKAAMSHYRVEHGAGVSLGEKQPVSSGPIGTGWIEAEMMKVERGEDFRNRKGTAEVSTLGFVYHAQHFDAEALCLYREVLDQTLCMVVHATPSALRIETVSSYDVAGRINVSTMESEL